ncbi:MAG: DUF262 domain-containing protein, partial [Bacteroidales bacterium]|nr:DUF262 domain-containing protein [Bacteroidales bacterium]
MNDNNQNKYYPLDIKKIFDSNYEIPLYQRNFDWDLPEIGEFICDIIYNSNLSDDNNNQPKPYYIGAIQVREKKDSNANYEVVDGQQRLTCLFLILAALNEFLRSCNNNNIFYLRPNSLTY